MGWSSSRVLSALGILVTLFLGWYAACHLSNFRAFAVDDAFMTFIYGRNLAEGHGIRYNARDADPVEGYSSFLHVALTAMGYTLGLDGLTATKGLGVLLFMSIPLSMGLAGSRVARAPPGAGVLLTAAVLMMSFCLPDTRYHLASAMDTILFAAVNAWLFTWALWAALSPTKPTRGTGALGIPLLALVSIARPEGPVLAAAYLAVIPAVCPPDERRERLRPWMVALAGWAILMTVYVVWKLWYFGHLLPNPYFVKSNHAVYGRGDVWLPGISSALGFLMSRFLPLTLIVLAMMLLEHVDARSRRAVLLVVPSLCIVIAYAGAIHELAFAHRYGYPFLFPLVGCLALWGAGAWDRFARTLTILTLAVVCAIPLLCAPGAKAMLGWVRHPIRSSTGWISHVPNGLAHAKLGLDLAETNLGQQATILLSGAGMAPYYSRFFAIDWIGLNTNRLSGRFPMTIEDVWGYIDARKPDVIYSLVPPASSGVTRRQDDPAFLGPVVQHSMSPAMSVLFEYWDRNRVEEMFYSEMQYVRDFYTFGAAYPLDGPGMLLCYVRKDSPHRDTILPVLRNSRRADRTTDLATLYLNDPRSL